MTPWELPSREVLAAPAGGAEEAHGSLPAMPPVMGIRVTSWDINFRLVVDESMDNT